MAKYCGICGAELDDNAKVCGNCGTPVDKAAVNTAEPKILNPEKKKKIKKTIKIIVILAAFIAAGIIVFSAISQHTGCNGLLRKVMAAYEGYDIDKLISISSDVYFYGDEDYCEEYFKSIVGKNLDSFEYSVGHNYKLSYEVNEIYTISERKMDEIIEGIEFNFPGFDTDTIIKVVDANLVLNAKRGSKSADIDIDVLMSKENGEWKLLYIQ